MSSSPHDIEADRVLLDTAITQAGAIAMRFFRSQLKVWYKGPNDPVSEADIAINDYLKTQLLGQRPSYGWLSEESHDDGSRLSCHRIWIIDPIDGTRAFLQGIPEFTISVALVENSRPIISAIFNPAQRELFTACRGCGAWLDGNRLRVSNKSDLVGAKLLTSHQRIAQAHVPKAFANVSIKSLGSIAYRLALTAAGRYDGVISLSGANDWDLAGADLLVNEANGCITTASGHRYYYNGSDPWHLSVIAANSTLHKFFVEQFNARD